MHRLAFTIAFLLLTNISRADDWPQWLGPTRDGVSKESLEPWKIDPKARWSVKVGEGHSGPIVADGVINGKKSKIVYLFTKKPSADPKDTPKEIIQAFDADGYSKDIKPIWENSYEKAPFESMFGNGPRATPVFDDGVVYSFGNTGVLSGMKWHKSGIEQVLFVDTFKQYGAKNLRFGMSASPLIVDKLIVVPVGGAGHGLVAFDKTTGKEAWKVTDDPASYAAPIYKNGQIICLTGANVIGVSPKGELLWKYPFKDALNESSTTPIVVVGDRVIVSSVTAGSVCLEVKEAEGKYTVKEVWKKPELSCYFSTPLVISDQHMLMVNGTVGLRPQPAKLRCVEIATGKITWEKNNVGQYHASLIKLANDKVLMLDDRGKLKMLGTSPREYIELCETELFSAPKGNAWAHPALADGKLYVRSATDLICYDLK